MREIVVGGGEVNSECPEKYWGSLLKKITSALIAKWGNKQTKKKTPIKCINFHYDLIISFLYKSCQGQHRYKTAFGEVMLLYGKKV